MPRQMGPQELSRWGDELIRDAGRAPVSGLVGRRVCVGPGGGR
jgi:hypothetical protein